MERRRNPRSSTSDLLRAYFPFLRAWLLTGMMCSSSVFVFAQAPSQAGFPKVSQSAAQAFTQSRFEEAARLSREAVKLRPGWAEGWGYLAASLFTMNQYAEAAEAYRRTTVLTPTNGPSWAYLGACEFELRRYRQAFDDLIKGRQLGLGEDQALLARVHYELGILWDTAGQFDMGAKELAFFADVGDKSDPVLEATGLNVLRIPLFPHEIALAKRELVMKAGEAGWTMGLHHIVDAKKLYEELIAAYPTEPNLHYRYGFILSAGDEPGAVAELEKELTISPTHVPAMIEAALLCLDMGQLEKSEQLAGRAIELEPKNYAPHNILGRVLMQTERAEQGIKELETAVRLAPSIATAHFNLAQAYQKAGKSSAAAHEFAAFKELNRQQEGQDAGAKANP